jgi:SLOG in TRPM, prokaryote/SMODS and SLOG-associating 2TM effector domain 1/Protein of unknown function (DUF4231)
VGTEPSAQPHHTVADFSNGYQPKLVKAQPGATPASLISQLGLEGRVGAPVLVVSSGGAELEAGALKRARDPFVSAMSRGGAAAAPTVIDCETAGGVLAVTGAARAAAPEAVPVLLGVVPIGKADRSDSSLPSGEHHTHFVVTDTARPDQATDLMFSLSDALGGKGPKALLLVGGDESAKAQALMAAEREWPIIVIAGTGGTADQIAAEWLSRHQPPKSAISRATPERFNGRLPRRLQHKRAPKLDAIKERSLQRIVGNDRLWVSKKDGDPSQLARQIAWELQDEPVLKGAWKTFAAYDGLAGSVRKTFERFQKSILVLGVVATLLALLASATKYAALHWAAVAAPIVVSSVIALANRRAAGKRWVVLRAAAESLKAEIYRYRTRTGVYADAKLPDQNPKMRDTVLADRTKTIGETLSRTEATNGVLPTYTGPLPPAMYGASRDDDGLSLLDAPTYVRLRLGDQMTYFEDRVKTLDRRREWLQALGVGAAGAGAILAAAGVAAWVGLTTAISGAALSYLGYLQVDNTIVTYNQAKTKLQLLDLGWKAQSVAGPDSDAFEKLVTEGEAVLSLELGGWVRQMTQAVDQLRADQAHAGGEAQRSAPGDAPAGGEAGGRPSAGGRRQARKPAAKSSGDGTDAASDKEAAKGPTEDPAGQTGEAGGA